jgi:enoyl-CoA hydratase
MTISSEKSGPVTTVILSRPEVRNAVDRATAEALAEALRVFYAHNSALVGVLCGAHGTVTLCPSLPTVK